MDENKNINTNEKIVEGKAINIKGLNIRPTYKIFVSAYSTDTDGIIAYASITPIEMKIEESAKKSIRKNEPDKRTRIIFPKS